MKLRILTVLTAALAVIAVGCSPGDGSDSGAAAPSTTVAALSDPTITFRDSTCRYEGPGFIESGLVEITFDNAGGEAAFVVMAVIPEEHPGDDEMAAQIVDWYNDYLSSPLVIGLETSMPEGTKTATYGMMTTGEMVVACLSDLTVNPQSISIADRTVTVEG